MMIAWLLVARLVSAATFTTTGGTLIVSFSPRGGCTETLIAEVARATSTVLVEAYQLTSTPILESLIAAHRRKVHVEVVVDPTTARYLKIDPAQTSDVTYPWLVNRGVTVWVDSRHQIMHDKIVIVDGKSVVMGSFNFSKNAEERNAENLLVIRNIHLAARYIQEWWVHRDHATRL